MRHGEVLAQVVVQRLQHGVQVAGGEQREAQAVHLFADGVVLLAELDQLRELALEHFAFFAQGEDLALGDRNRAAAVRMRDVDLRQQFGIVFEETGVVLQVAYDFFSFHRFLFLPRTR